MSLNISTNTAALRAGSYLSQNNAKLQRSFDRLASGKKISSPVEDPGSLAVSMKLSASINRLAGAVNNIQNAQSFLEVQDGMLDTVGRIVDRMSELKGLASQDPMKSAQDRASYNNEFKDLQVQLYNISQQSFNGMSLFANHTTNADGVNTSTQILFDAENTTRANDNTIDIFTSGQGSSGSKVSIHKSALLSALTLSKGQVNAGGSGGGTGTSDWSQVNSAMANGGGANATWVTFAADEIDETLDLDHISVGVITKALENIAYLRAQSGGSQSRLAFNLESISQQKTNMRAALGRIVDVDIAEESTNLAKYSILNQAAASMLAQANASSDVALLLLR
ncbi:flagellin [Opitutales bacterium]|nr:flagellin [Opitutales bacterium]